MPWIIATMLILAVIFSYWGWRWESRKRTPPLKRKPLVSVIIPNYNSPHLQEAVDSAKNLDYPNKEIIVVDDSSDPLPPQKGVMIIRNRTRTGKATALNQAVSHAKGEILYFIDSDTVTAPDALNKLVPWFSKGVAAVSPKFAIKNRDNFLTKLISLEHYFLSSLFKIHMRFGSLISFRGCGIAISAQALKDVGGWKNTLIEDVDLATTFVKKGYKIMYEPDALVETIEPANWKEFKKQRMRWGKGTGFSFFKHHAHYFRSPQFAVYIFPYLLLGLAVVGFFLFQTAVYLLPIASVYLIYSISLRELLAVSILFMIPLAGSLGTSTTIASITHFAIVTNGERKEGLEGLRDLAFVIPYVFIYFPVTMTIYIRGIIAAIADKRKHRDEMSFKYW